MPTTTSNMGLTKPGLTDTADITVLDTDMDIVDAHDHTNGKGVQIPTAGIADAAVTAAKIAAGAVGTSQIANNAVTATQIAAGAVGNSQIAAGAVGTTSIANQAVTATQVANGAIGTAQIANNAVTATQVANGTITTTQISGTAGITGSQLANQTVTATQIANNAVGAAQMANSSVGPTQLAAGLGAAVYNTVAQSIANITTTALTFNSTRKDTNGFLQAASQLKAAQAGWYIITGSASYAGNGSGSQRALSIRLNGGAVIAAVIVPPAGANNTNLSVSRVWYLNATDYVELLAFQDSGGALNVNASLDYSPEFSIAFIAP